MKIKDEKIEIVRDGKIIKTIHLNRGTPRFCYYLENAGKTAETAGNKPKRKAEIEYNTRAAQAFFDNAVKAVRDIAKVDGETAADIINGFLDVLYRQNAAGKRRRDAKDMPENGTSSITPLSPERRAIIAGLEEVDRLEEELAEREIETGVYDEEAEDRLFEKQEEAEAPLDALALEDPEEATLIYRNSPLMERDPIESDCIYLGHGIKLFRTAMKDLNTLEKRRVFVAAFNRDPTDEEIEAVGGRYNDNDRYNAGMRAVHAYIESGGSVPVIEYTDEDLIIIDG